MSIELVSTCNGGKASGAGIAVVQGAVRHVIEASGVGVDERVEEAQRGLALQQSHVVQLREDAGHHGTRGRGAGHSAEGAAAVGHAVRVHLAAYGHKWTRWMMNMERLRKR